MNVTQQLLVNRMTTAGHMVKHKEAVEVSHQKGGSSPPFLMVI